MVRKLRKSIVQCRPSLTAADLMPVQQVVGVHGLAGLVREDQTFGSGIFGAFPRCEIRRELPPAALTKQPWGEVCKSPAPGEPFMGRSG